MVVNKIDEGAFFKERVDIEECVVEKLIRGSEVESGRGV